jgi:hypothetical protein
MVEPSHDAREWVWGAKREEVRVYHTGVARPHESWRNNNEEISRGSVACAYEEGRFARACDGRVSAELFFRPAQKLQQVKELLFREHRFENRGHGRNG